MKPKPLMVQAELAAWAERGGRRPGWHQPVRAGCQDRAEALSSIIANPNNVSETKLRDVKHCGLGHIAEEQRRSPHKTGSGAPPPSALLSHHAPREAPPRLHMAGRDKQVENPEEGNGQVPAPLPRASSYPLGARVKAECADTRTQQGQRRGVRWGGTLEVPTRHAKLPIWNC